MIISLVLLGLAAYWNWYAPDLDYWPQLVADGLTIIPAIGAAIAATFLLRQFNADDKPRRIWFWFAAGWWSWVLGEICGMVYDILQAPYGEISYYDIFWTVGYFCFGLALFFQYRNIYSTERKNATVSYLVAVVIILLITLGFTQWALYAGLGEGISWFALYLAVFYPVCDLAVGLMALWLVFLFGGGAWGRPWWGLIIFAIADAINIFLWIGGERLIPENMAGFLDPLSSTIYNAGYLVVMLGFLFIIMLNFWPALPKSTEIAEQAN